MRRPRVTSAFIVVLSLLALATGGHGAGYPEPGTNAPPFKDITWINTPTNRGVDMRNKVVVLDFWTTWCDVCRLTLPRMNELSRQFGGDSVVFVLMSNESPQVVAEFLTKNTVHPAIACDTTSLTYEAYDIRRIPRTFLIDEIGVVSWYGHPNSITAKVLDRYLKTGEVPPIAFEADSLRIPELVKISEPGFSISVNHAQSGYRFGLQSESSIIEREVGRRYEIEFKGRRLSEIVSRLSGEPLTRIRFNLGMEFEPIFDLSLDVSPPMEFEPGRAKALEIFCDALQLKINNVVTPTSGLTMTIGAPGFLVRAAAPGATTRLEGTQWIGTGVTLGQLAEHLESQLGIIIWNDTSTDGEYDLSVPVSNLSTAKADLITKYGIALEAATRPVSILVLESIR